MRKRNNKKIIFGLFTLICIPSLCVFFTNKTTNNKLSFNDEINLGDTKDSCETIDYEKCGCNSIANSSAQEQCRKGCSYCSTCKSGSYKSEGYCYKTTSSTVSEVTVSGKNYIYIAEDESAIFTFNAKSSSSDFTPSWSFNPSTGANGRSTGTTYYLTASGTASGTGSSCKETSYTVTATSNNTSKSATVKVCRYCSSWKGPYNASGVYTTKQNTSKQERGCYYFIGESKVDGGWTYTGYYSRCCGSVPTSEPVVTPPPTTEPTPTPTPIPKACYGDKKNLGIATNVGWQESESTARPYKYDGISEDECKVIDVSSCSVSPTVPMPVDVETEVCEEKKEISFKDITKCSSKDGSTTGNFYTIECNRKIVTDFDYGDDDKTDTSRVLRRGQGFKFGVKVTSTQTCNASFNKNAWVNTYNKFLKKIGYVSSSLVNYVKNYDKNGWTKAVNALNASKETQSEVYALWNIIEKLRNVVVNDYLGFTPTDIEEENANLSLKYSINGKQKNQDAVLIISGQDYSSGGYTKTLSKTSFDLLNQTDLKNIPESYTISNENNPRVMKFIPTNAYIEKYLGLDMLETVENAVAGGNKIYLDYNADTGSGKTYNLSIKVTGLGSNKSTVTNNKCDIKVGSEELLYRPIDVGNPFIDSKWNIGRNWLNDKYSFTNTIKSDTWSLDSLYVISLPNADIKAIQESNKTFTNDYPYLGLCDRINSSKHDNITKKLCGIVKSTID